VAEAGTVALSSIGQVGVRVLDLERAVAFYRDALGLKLLFQAPPGLAFFDCGGVRLMLDRPEGPEFDHASSVLYFRVEDIGAGFDCLAARGVGFRDPPHMVAKLPDHELWMAFFDDGEGNVHALMCEMR
jgi:methylmalonyl-CoA/ethylmalonyl-CoA epimerase